MVTAIAILVLFGLFAAGVSRLGKGFEAFCSGWSKLHPAKGSTPPKVTQVYVIVIANDSLPSHSDK
jgi:hypothetical protein